ncbi:hypothetical protein GMLC_35750 [Geomonas limicola]|uniref:histidine kinase n=1 Tax=Geomonas limicola TaxID=2740186 RepID=A0A6V8NBV2_9BACT|nr:PAS domain S-box protein [Geomonas limicola]GFO69996.1 hypothetical protein GMLC_35750 [Geomonas limicola]
MSIKTKITWTVFLLVASLTVLLTLVGYHLAETFKEAVSRQSLALVGMGARHIDEDIGNSQQMLAQLALEFTPETLADPQHAQRLLDHEETARAFFDGGLQLLDQDGRVVAASPAVAGKRGASLKGHDYAAMVLATGKPYVSNPYLNVQTPTVSIAVALRDPEGAITGVLAGHINLLRGGGLADFGHLDLGKHSTFFLISRNRTVILHPDRRRVLTRIEPGTSPGLDLALQGNLSAPVQAANQRGDQEITTAQALKRADWLYVSQNPLSVLYAPLERARLWAAVVLACTLGLTYLALCYLVRHVTAPLSRLTERVRALPVLPEREHRPELAGDEVEALSGAVSEMVQEIDLRLRQGRELERLLEEQREFAEKLLESTSTPLFAIDTGHRVIIWNRAMEELTGVRAQQMLGSSRQWQPFYQEERPTLCDLVLDDKTDEIGRFYHSYACDVVMHGIVRAEGRFASLGGRERYLIFDAAPVHKEGRVVAVVETLYDITARVRAEEQLRLLSQAVEQSASTVVITDPNGTISYVNRKFCEITGYQFPEAIGQNPRILKSGMQGPELYAELWGTIRSGREWHGELHNRRKDGTAFWEKVIISPILDADGRISHFLAIKEDITERKQTERRLQQKQAELVVKHEQLTELFRLVERGKREWEQTLDCIDDMVVMADRTGAVRRYNRAFQSFVGYSHQELGNRDWRELLREAGLGLESLEGGSGELFHAASRRWLTLKTYPYDEGRGEVITLHDLTQIKEVSEQLAQAFQELKATHSQLLQQEKMASIGQLAAGVAHEINNPMGFISSNLGTMEKYLQRLAGFLGQQSDAVAQCAPEALREELARARRSFKVDYILSDAASLLSESQEGADRVRRIVQNLKSFSRVDDTQATYVDLNECLESTISIAWNELKYKTTLNRDYGTLPQVKCLPQQLNQVFLNILVNAAHAIEKQGGVTVTTRAEGERVSVAIADTGCGIPEEIRGRIFEPFFTTKEVGKGTGLGLSISYDIIKKHGGSIEVESEPGKGTTFTVWLPVEGVTT